MSAVAWAPAEAAEQPREQRQLFAVAAPPAETVTGPSAGGETRRQPTLAGALDRSWARLRAAASADCVVCGGLVEPRWSAGHGIVGGRCRGCGTQLD